MDYGNIGLGKKEDRSLPGTVRVFLEYTGVQFEKSKVWESTKVNLGACNFTTDE
jgi:hypothetical protein